MPSPPRQPLYQFRGRRPSYNSAKRVGNFGLLFQKFPDRWGLNKSDAIAFDPRSTDDDRESWLRKIAGTHPHDRTTQSKSQAVGNLDAIRETVERLCLLVEKRGGRLFAIKNQTRFLTGAGLEHPTRNGILLHPTLGVPYIAGSTVKGIFSAWNWQTLWPDHVGDDGEYDEERQREHNAAYKKQFRSLSGTEDQVGGVQFTDVLPVRSVELDVEILTPHYGEYYGASVGPPANEDDASRQQQRDPLNVPPPGDWISPVPVEYLTVAPDQIWIGGVIPSPRSKQHSIGDVLDALRTAIEELGIGAKTEVGLGVFEFLDEPNEHRPDFLKTAAKAANAKPMVENLLEEFDFEDEQVERIMNVGGDTDQTRPQAILRFYESIQKSGEPMSIDAARWIGQMYLGTDVIKALPEGAETAAKKKKKLQKKASLLQQFLPVIQAMIDAAS